MRRIDRSCLTIEEGWCSATVGFHAGEIGVTSSASTSFVSLCTGPRDFARFDGCSLFFRELLSFFKVDLLIHCDCTVECVDQGSSSPSLIGDRPSHPIYRLLRELSYRKETRNLKTIIFREGCYRREANTSNHGDVSGFTPREQEG